MDAPDLNVVGQLPQGSQTLVKMSEADYLAWSPKCGCCERGDGDSPVHYWLGSCNSNRMGSRLTLPSRCWTLELKSCD